MSENISEVLAKLYGKMEAVEPKTREDIERWKVEQYNQSSGSLNEADGYNCHICKNKGFISRFDEVHKCEICVECKCRKIRATLRRAKRSGLGNVLTDCTFDKFEVHDDWQKSIKETAQKFCMDDNAKWFYIGGQVGCGKSHICTAICGHYMKTGHEVLYMLWAEESKRLKAMVNDVSYHDTIGQYKSVDVLYIDDFLKVKSGESPTPADINLAFEIINHRLVENKITIISSEKTLDEVMEYDEATMSRIYQKTGIYKIGIGKDRSKNYRLRGMIQL